MKSQLHPAKIKEDVAGLTLMVSLLVSLLILPLFEGLRSGRTILIVGFSIVFLATIFSAKKGFRFGILIFALIAIPASWATLLVQSKPVFIGHCIVGCVFFWYVGAATVTSALQRHVLAVDSVFRAISAYLMFGLAWALAYWAIDVQWDDSFPTISSSAQFNPDSSEPVKFSEFIYYSFVTMSTLGYGDITPEGRVTRTMSWIQSVTGQFYVAVVIAWLVNALPRPPRNETSTATARATPKEIGSAKD